MIAYLVDLMALVELGNVKFSGLKRLSQTILSNCCQKGSDDTYFEETDSESSDDSDFEPRRTDIKIQRRGCLNFFLCLELFADSLL